MLGRERYYVDEGRGHDYLLRCKDCMGLVIFDAIQKLGACDKCGNKRFTEITLLNEAEMASLVDGTIDFPDKAEFLAEFRNSDIIDAEARETVRLEHERALEEEEVHRTNGDGHQAAACRICQQEREDKEEYGFEQGNE